MAEIHYVRASQISEAISLLNEPGNNSCPLAGGTDLVLQLRNDPTLYDRVVDISQIPELHQINRVGDVVTIGATATFNEVMSHPIIMETAPLLVQACRQVGAVQIRNRGTLGGNVANAAACADSLPALVCLDAIAHVLTPKEEFNWPVAELIIKPNLTLIPLGGLLVSFSFPVQFLLPRLSPDSQANVGLFIAIALGIILAILLFRTTLGYEFRLVGKNSLFSSYGGINTKKVALSSMCLSGAIGGLVGVIEVLGVHRRFPSQFGNGLGFDGIVVSLLAGNHPIGVIFSGFFFGALRNGAMSMERLTNVPRAMVDIVNAIVVLMASAQFAITYFRNRSKRKSPLEREVTKVDRVLKNPGED